MAGCGVDPARADGTEDTARAAEALAVDGQVCITLQRGADPASVADAVLWQNAPGWNDGTSPNLGTGTSETGGLRRSLLRFDLSGVPSGAEVVSANLSISQTYKVVDSTVRIHRVTSAWEEPTVTWASFGEAFDPAVAASFTSGGGAGVRSSDVTALAQAWVSGASANHGVLLEEDPVLRTEYRSSEKTAVELRPKLDLCYVPRDDGGVGAPIIITSPAAGAESSYRRSIIRWEPIAGASSYHLEIDDDPNFRSPEIDTRVNGTSFALDGRELALNGARSWPAYVRINGTRWDAGTFAPAIFSPGDLSAVTSAPDGTVHLALRKGISVHHVTSDDWSRHTVISSPEIYFPGMVDMEADPVTGDVHAAWIEPRSPSSSGRELFYAGSLSGWQAVRVSDALGLSDVGGQAPTIAAYGGVVDLFHPSSSGILRFRTHDGRDFVSSNVESSARQPVEAVLAPDGRTVLVAAFTEYGRDEFVGRYGFYPSFGVFDQVSGWVRPTPTGSWHYPSVAVGPDHAIHVIATEGDGHVSGRTLYSNSLRGFARWTPTPLGLPQQDTRSMVVDAGGRIYLIGAGEEYYEARLVWSDDNGETWSSRELPGAGHGSDIDVGPDGVVHIAWRGVGGGAYANSLGAFLASNLPPEIDVDGPAYTDAEVSIAAAVSDPDENELSGQAVVGVSRRAPVALGLDDTVEILGASVRCDVWYLASDFWDVGLEFRVAGTEPWTWDVSYQRIAHLTFPLVIEARDPSRPDEHGSFMIEAWDPGLFPEPVVRIRDFDEAARVPWTGEPTLTVPITDIPSGAAALLLLDVTDGTSRRSRLQGFARGGQQSLRLVARPR
ncbi:hypothetical protein BE04_11305 [Sorangium cellulosum]|uniref:Carbohydrate-binding module family 96 domain-containing protein n=1 Tax=Sorangium cellulosum TaxID=56 RepID=A0A150PXM4_SORCE|nr:hypothetical protein BE04_11305 [Sorangium cellulosum]